MRIGNSALFVAVLSLAFFGCSRHEHAADHAAHGHAHQAPHGGSLIELGEHHFQIEFVHDRSAGRLTAYILDGHAENSVRVEAPTIPLLIDRNGGTETLELRAVANQLSNERVGDTSEFAVEADWLKSANMISGRIGEVRIRGQTYTEVPFVLW